MYIFTNVLHLLQRKRKGPRQKKKGLRINGRMIRHKADKGIKFLLGHKNYRCKGMSQTNSAVKDSHTGIRSINLANTIFW